MNSRAFSAVALGAIITSISGLLIKNMSIPATSMTWIRTMIPTIVMGLWMTMKGIKFFRGSKKFLFTVSALNAIRMYLFFLTYVFTSIGNAVIILYTWPIFATVFGFLVLKESISQKHILLLTMAFVGLIVVNLDKSFSWGSTDFLGMMAGLGCAIIYSLMMVLFKRESGQYQLTEMIFYQNLLASVVFLPFFINNDPFPSSKDWMLSSTQGILVGLIAYLLFFYGLRHLKASTHSMITYLEIVCAIALGYVFLGETLSINTIIGGIIIVMSTALLKIK